MGEYHLVGDLIDKDNCPAVFELKLHDHLPCIDPKTFGLADVPSIDPCNYFISSGDALAKAIKLEADLRALEDQLQAGPKRDPPYRAKERRALNAKRKKYIDSIRKCADLCHNMVDKLCEAKGTNCFLETEWREQRLIVIPKNPRVKQ